ncbi:hypothetical protein SASPL_118815 [Salvia splendens]|uniref:Checkpoint protein n=1 Tax=Salvia splendens TaxID=180675 RepID=A0A8X8XXF4_SALSN|nr:hypothetical protein SASPL_118815 [Salvia splendens]
MLRYAIFTNERMKTLCKIWLVGFHDFGISSHRLIHRRSLFALFYILSYTPSVLAGIPFMINQFQNILIYNDNMMQSKNGRLAAFMLDIACGSMAVSSDVIVEAETIETAIRQLMDPENKIRLKLVKKLPPNSTQATPFLTFEARGHRSAVVQDVPVSKPLSRADVHELHLAVESCEQLPATLVMAPELSSLHSFVDGMKHVGDVMAVSVSKYGDLHLQISTSLIALGAEFRKLKVLGERADPVAEDSGLSAKTRVERGVQRGDAMTVQVSVKHFFKSLQCSLAKPDCAFFGIAPQGACLMVFFQFFVPGTRVTDKSFSLHCKLPVLDTGSS